MLGIGAHRIELYTEHYARAFDTGSFEHELLQYCAAAEVALDLGLEVTAASEAQYLHT